MFNSLSSYHQVTWIGYKNLSLWLRFLIKFQTFLDQLFNIKRGYPYFNKWLSILKAGNLQKHVNTGSFDIIVSANSPDFVAYLSSDIPIIYVRDTTFQLFINYYPTFFGLNDSAIKDGNEIERRAINNAWKVIYSSNWAAESAIGFYNADKEKISIIDFGANFLFDCSQSIPVSSDSAEEVCNILFIGIDWVRKGGLVAYKTFLRLRNEGIKCRFIVTGCEVTLEQDADVEIIPFLNKEKSEDLDRLIDIYSRSHFVVLPTLADCTPIVFSEAAAFGIPVLTTNTGGNSSVIYEGVNGYLFLPGTDEIPYADKIKAIFGNKNFYNNLRKTCRNEFDTRLSWNVWVGRVNALISGTASNSDQFTGEGESTNSYESSEKLLHG